MRVFDRFFTLFREGAGDAGARKTAAEVYEKTLEALRKRREDDLVSGKGKLPVVSANIGELTGDESLDDLDIVFRYTGGPGGAEKRARMQSAAFATSKDKKKKFIVLNVGGEDSVSQDEWDDKVSAGAADFFSSVREKFVHEFIHYLDWKRMKDPESAFGKKYDPETQKSDYFNDPVEINAYIQQGLSAIENHLKGVKSWQAAQKVVGKSAEEFVKKVKAALPKTVISNMSDETLRRLAKRAAAMWTDVKAGFSK